MYIYVAPLKFLCNPFKCGENCCCSCSILGSLVLKIRDLKLYIIWPESVGSLLSKMLSPELSTI